MTNADECEIGLTSASQRSPGASAPIPEAAMGGIFQKLHRVTRKSKASKTERVPALLSFRAMSPHTLPNGLSGAKKKT